MFIKQLSVFIENKPGRLAEVSKVIAGAGIDIRALCIADTADFGILRMVVDKPGEAENTLRAAGLTVSLTNVIAVGIEDKPGGFANAAAILAEKDVSVEYMYAFVSRESSRAYLIMRVRDSERAARILIDSGVELLTEDKVYKM